MAKIKPFKGVRPPKEFIEEVASRPYDVLNSQEARAEAEGNEKSLYHIIKPEIDFPEGTDEHDPAVYLKAAANFNNFQEKVIKRQPVFRLPYSMFATYSFMSFAISENNSDNSKQSCFVSSCKKYSSHSSTSQNSSFYSVLKKLFHYLFFKYCSIFFKLGIITYIFCHKNSLSHIIIFYSELLYKRKRQPIARLPFWGLGKVMFFLCSVYIKAYFLRT